MSTTVRLTKSKVDSLPFVTDGQQYYWDDKEPGFGLRVGQSTKAYFVERRVRGRTVRATIGKHGPWTAEKARERAKELRVDMDKGIDLIARERDAKATQRARSATLDEVLTQYLKTRDLKESTVADYQTIIDGAFADWRNRPIATITRDMVARRHAELGKASKARANLAMRVLRALFNFAMGQYEDSNGQPIIGSNPVKRLSQTRAWYSVDRRQTYIKPHELKPWFDAVCKLAEVETAGTLRDDHGRFVEGAAAYNSRPNVVRDYLLLLLFTGLRRSEAAKLHWEHVDFDSRTLTVIDPKNRETHTLPLPEYLVNLLTARKESTGDSNFVFPAESERGYLVEPRKQMERVTAASGVSFTLHDLRRTFATIAESLDISAYALKRLLNHKMKNDVTAGYIVTDVERLRGPMEKIAGFILQNVGRQPNVIPENNSMLATEGNVV